MSDNTYSRAGLDEELANRCPVVHGVEGGDLVDTLGRHFETAGDLVHDADAGEAVLALTEIEKGHNGGLLVLGRVALEDLGNDGLVLLVELEGDVRVVVVGVAVLGAHVSQWQLQRQSPGALIPEDHVEGGEEHSPPGVYRSRGKQCPRKRGSAEALPRGPPTGQRS